MLVDEIGEGTIFLLREWLSRIKIKEDVYDTVCNLELWIIMSSQ